MIQNSHPQSSGIWLWKFQFGFMFGGGWEVGYRVKILTLLWVIGKKKFILSTEFSFRHLKLTAEQKCDIAQRELEELRDEIEKLKDESEKILDNFRVGQFISLLDFLKICF